MSEEGVSRIHRARVYRATVKAKKRLDANAERIPPKRSKVSRGASKVFEKVDPPTVTRVVGRESAYIVRMAGTYAYGLTDHAARLAGKVAPLPDAPHRNLPVILLHGVAHNHSWSLRMQTDLRLVGFRTYSMNYATFGQGSIEECAIDVVHQIAVVMERFGTDRVHLVGHSLAGLVIREAINEYEYLRPAVATVVTIGTPHRGTPIAFGWTSRIPVLGSLFGEMHVDSDTLRRLDERANKGEARWTSVWSPNDEFVPGKYGELRNPVYGAASVELKGLGHYGLTYDPRALDLVRDLVIDSDSAYGEYGMAD